MTSEYTQAVLRRANQLQRLEAAVAAMLRGSDVLIRAGWAVALATLMMMIPSISAAQMIF